MGAESIHDFLVREMREVHGVFPNLTLERGEDGCFVVRGSLGFRVPWNGTIVQDSYDIELAILSDYPQSAPTVRELGRRIPREFHMYLDGALCLGAPLAVAMTLAEEATLLGYLRRLVVPFLFSFSYKQQFGSMPYGELAHGGEGILDYYRDLFDVRDELAVLGLLDVVARRYRGHAACPCKSGKKLRACHGPSVVALLRFRSRAGFLEDMGRILNYLKGRESNPGKEPLTGHVAVPPGKQGTASCG